MEVMCEMGKLRKLLFGYDNESLEAYVQECKEKYSLTRHPLLASNRKARPEQMYSEPR